MFKEFKWIKDNAVDKDAMLKYMNDKVKEESWKPVSKTVIEKCADETTANKDKIEKELAAAPFNISKDKCNPVFMSMLVCVQLEGFVVSVLFKSLKCFWVNKIFNRAARKTSGPTQKDAQRPKIGSLSAATKLNRW